MEQSLDEGHSGISFGSSCWKLEPFPDATCYIEPILVVLESIVGNSFCIEFLKGGT